MPSPNDPLLEEDYPEYLKKKKKKKQQGMPGWVLPSAAIGGLGTATAYGLASDSHANLLRKRLEEFSAPQAPHETGTTKYVNLMSAAANSRPLGLSMPQVLLNIRQSPTLMRLLMRPGSDLISNQRQLIDGSGHYNSYQRGPLNAYSHEINHRFRDVEVPAAELPADVAKGKPVKYSDLVGPHFRKAMNDYQKQHLGEPPKYNPDLELAGVDQTTMPNEQQAEVLAQYGKNLPAWLQTIRKKYENIDRHPGTTGYTPVTQALLNTRDVAKNVGFTAGGAATGGALGHYLGGLVTRKKKRTWLDDLAQSAVAAGSAGLGGYAGYMASRPAAKQ